MTRKNDIRVSGSDISSDTGKLDKAKQRYDSQNIVIRRESGMPIEPQISSPDKHWYEVERQYEGQEQHRCSQESGQVRGRLVIVRSETAMSEYNSHR